MKKILFPLLLASLALGVASCDIADGKGNGAYSDEGVVENNGVYMSRAGGKEAVAVLVETGKGGFATITPRLAAPIDQDIQVTLKVDPIVVNKYAEDNNLKLHPVDAADVVFMSESGQEVNSEITLTIPAGSTTSAVSVGVKDLPEEKYPFNEKWGLGVRITDTNLDLPVLSDPQTSIVTFNRMYNSSALHWISSRESMKVQMNEPITEDLTEWTFQMQVYFSKLQRNDCSVASPNQTVANIYGVPAGMEWYTRIAYEGGIQLKTGRDGDDTWTNKPLTDKTWMQVTFTFRRTGLNRGVSSVYVDGELQKSWETQDYMWTAGTKEAGWSIGACPWGNDYIREIKMWNKVLTPAEMQDKLYLPEDPNNPNLIFYVPLSKETVTIGDDGSVSIQELTGNATVFVPNTLSADVQDNIVFPNKDMVIAEPLDE